MATLPTIPTFVTNDSSLTKLQQLSQAVSFLVDCDVKPVCHLYKTATASLTASTWNTLNFGSMAYDNDGMWTSSSFMTIQTNGYFAFEGCLGFETGTSAISCALSFFLTAGASNPLQATINASGGGTRFGNRGGQSVTISGADTTYCISDICPYALYSGDQVLMHAQPSSAVTSDCQTPGVSIPSYQKGRFNANFTGMWIRHV